MIEPKITLALPSRSFASFASFAFNFLGPEQLNAKGAKGAKGNSQV